MKKTVSILIFLLYEATASVLEFHIELKVNETRFITSPNYPASIPVDTEARWNVICPVGYNCKLHCPTVQLDLSYMCSKERLVVSKSETTNFYGGKIYCGERHHVNVISTGYVMAIEYLADNTTKKNSRFTCTLSSIRIPGPRKHGDQFVLDDSMECDCGKNIFWPDKENTKRYINANSSLAIYVTQYPIVGMEGYNKMKCMGTIFHEKYVLTTASCLLLLGTDNKIVIKGDRSDPRTANQKIKIEFEGTTGLPENYRYGRRQTGVKLRENTVKTAIEELSYFADYNIAVIVITNPTFHDFVKIQKPVCLPYKYKGWDFKGKEVITASWQSETVSTIENYNMKPSNDTGRNLIYVRKNSCLDYYGAPLIYHDHQTGRRTIIGMKVTETAYLKIENMLDWIYQHTRFDTCKPV